jgi:hypothetical protein
MRAEYDVVENIKNKENYREVNNRFLKNLLSLLVFVFINAIFFSTTYHIAFNYFQGLEVRRGAIEQNNMETRKTYYIEQKIRRDLERMQMDLD